MNFFNSYNKFGDLILQLQIKFYTKKSKNYIIYQINCLHKIAGERSSSIEYDWL